MWSATDLEVAVRDEKMKRVGWVENWKDKISYIHRLGGCSRKTVGNVYIPAVDSHYWPQKM